MLIIGFHKNGNADGRSETVFPRSQNFGRLVEFCEQGATFGHHGRLETQLKVLHKRESLVKFSFQIQRNVALVHSFPPKDGKCGQGGNTGSQI